MLFRLAAVAWKWETVFRPFSLFLRGNVIALIVRPSRFRNKSLPPLDARSIRFNVRSSFPEFLHSSKLEETQSLDFTDLLLN